MSSLSENVPEYIVWLDIDNTLYTSNARISELMMQKIHSYFVNDLGLEEEEAKALHQEYYTKYGLSLRGLIRHHGADPLDFDKKCDQSLPLEDLLSEDARTRKLLEDIDRSKVRVWGLTNAYITHASRVLRILNLDDLMENVVYCDYAAKDFACKPEAVYYQKAMEKASVTDPSKCLFVDDSLQNVQAAKKLGWGSCVYFREKRTVEGVLKNEGPIEGVDATIENLEELRTVWKYIFKPDNNSATT
ncbi:hypothetical protein M422DRAFT_22760 [Sphaerobolus stellatus SS14]|nr:hypothetical protein M422DRAFT_22760 [Sphaerobolus stellatus SS14]